jgi:DNA primase large subunit
LVTVNDRPSASELVEAVSEFLERDVLTATEGRVQFHTRVAINALGMVQRELELGPGSTTREQEQALAAEIRSGALDDELDDVRARVRASVREKLLVANPQYLDEGGQRTGGEAARPKP